MAAFIDPTYNIIREIGSGGGGVVYLAEHLRLNKKVVLKLDKRKITTHPELLRREVDVLKDLSHPYIPKVYDFFAQDDTVYTVMDYIEGESLDKPLKNGEKIDQLHLIKWSHQLLEALDYLHSPTHGSPPRGFVHSDIKPANLMRTVHDDICLIDFNISLALGEVNVIGCSAGYASPEHYGLDYSLGLEGGGDTTVLLSPESEMSTSSSSVRRVTPDVRSDIYSTGATMYHLLSGRRPDRDARLVTKLSEKEFDPQLVRIIAKAMEPNPDLRYQTAAEMLYDLDHLHENDPRTKRLKRARAVTAAVLSVLLVTGTLSAFVGLKRMQSTENSLKLAEYSRNAFESGDVDLAADYALRSAPEPGLLVPAASAKVYGALADSLGVYDLTDTFKPYKLVTLPSSPLSARISPDGRTAACVYSGTTAVIDTSSAEILAELPTDISALSDAEFIDNDTLLYAGTGGLTAYDIKNGKTLWMGKQATLIKISADRKHAAVLQKDADTAYIYDTSNGEQTAAVSLGGRRISRAANDIFVDPEDNLFAPNSDGSLLAISFSDGSLCVYDTSSGEEIELLEAGSGFTHFEGGFFGQYLAFSAVDAEGSGFVVIDCTTFEQTGGFYSPDRYTVVADEDGICVGTGNLLVKIDPVSGDQIPLITTAENVTGSAVGSSYTIAAADRKVMFFDGSARMISSITNAYPADHICLGNDTALIGSSSSPDVRIMKLDDRSDKNAAVYDPEYLHDEARLTRQGNVLLFSINGFRMCAADGTVLTETAFDDPQSIYDQLFIRENGDEYLKVIFYDGTVVRYSAEDGSVLSTEKGDPPDSSLYEELYTDDYRIESPLHGTPTAYRRDTGELAAELDSDGYLTYITQSGAYVTAQYMTAEGEYYGVLMNDKLEELARFPGLCDVIGEKLVFDLPSGCIRTTEIRSIEELRSAAAAKAAQQ